MKIKISEIKVTKQLRNRDRHFTMKVANAILSSGKPIVLSKDNTLLDGYARVMAAKFLGVQEIEYIKI